MRTYKENAELFLNYLHDNGCNRTGYYASEPVELKFDGDCYCIRLYSQYAEILFSFMEDGEVTIYTEYDEDGEENYITVNKSFTNFNNFCDWYKSQEFIWTDDCGADVVNLKK